MPYSTKRPRLTFEPDFQTLSEIQSLLMVQDPIPEEEEEEETSISSCSFTFSCPSSSPPSSPLILGTTEKKQQEEQEEEKKREEKEKEEEKEQQEEQEQEEEEMEQEQEEEKEQEGEQEQQEEEKEHKEEVEQEQEEEKEQEGQQVEEVEKEQEEEEKEQEEEEERKEEEQEEEKGQEEQKPLECPGSFFSSTSWSTSDEDSSCQEEEGTGSLQASKDTESLPGDLLNEKVANLVRFMILKYQQKEPITKAEMLKVVIKRGNKQFPVIFQKASKCLEVISGIDVKEVDPKTHSYVLVNSLGLTHDKIVNDDQSMLTNGLLIIILGLIFIEGNCVPEENIWDFLNMIGIHAGRKHFIYGEPRKLITRDWVQENYLEYRMVPNSDPLRYEFLWGPRAYAETSKLKVLEFLAKIKGIDPISFSSWYEEALRDEEERAGARNNSMDSNTAMFIVQHLPVIPDPTEECTVFEEGSQVSK